MRDLQYGIAWGLAYGGIAVLTDYPAWRLIVAGVLFSLAFAILLDWIRATTKPPDPRDRWRR